MPNGINDISPDLRDWLLNKNLILADSITENGLASLGVGLGHMGEIETLPNAVQPSQNIVVNGQFYRDLNLINNPYTSLTGFDEIDINTNTVINIGNLPVGTQPVSYQENIGSENPDSYFNQLSNTAREQMLKNKYYDENELIKINLNTVLISSTSGGVYQFKESLLARSIDTILNATGLGGVSQQLGVIGEDTLLGQIGDQELVKHFGYNAAFGLSQETLGHINLNPLSLLHGNDILIPNYSITVPKNGLKGVIDYGTKALGFNIPVSLLEQSSSIFASENPIDNINRLNSMVLNTGKGQVLAMIDNLNQNKYRPTITDDRQRENITKGDTGTNGLLYAFESAESGRILDLLNTSPDIVRQSNGENEALADRPNPINETTFEKNYGKITSELDGGFNNDFADLENINRLDNTKRSFSWGDTNNNPEVFDDERGVFNYTSLFNDKPKSLLAKTKQLFSTNRMMTLVSGHGVLGQNTNETQNTVRGYMSKGSGVLSKQALLSDDGTALPPDSTFCRTWTTFDRYNTVEDLQKHRGIDINAGHTIRKNTTKSVLDDNGFVRISPYVTDFDDEPMINGSTMKRFMFSIENLAWDGFAEQFLPTCEQGPGDPITGTKGRIMWFPPYGMNFTDNTSIDWTKTDFIGRGEPIYTYNNTERSGTLQWQMIIDHATYINDIRDAGASDEIFASIAAGCMDLDSIIGEKLSQVEKDKIEVAVAQVPKVVKPDPQIPPSPFKIYFPNDRSTLIASYENGDGQGVGDIMADEGYVTSALNKKGLHSYPDRTDFGLNGCSSGNTAGCPQGQKIVLDGETFNGWNGEYLNILAEYLITKCPACKINISGYHSTDGLGSAAAKANDKLSADRAKHVETKFRSLLTIAAQNAGVDPRLDERIVKVKGFGVGGSPQACPPSKKVNGKRIYDVDTLCKKKARYTEVSFEYTPALDERLITAEPEIVKPNNADLSLEIKKRYFNECTYFHKLKQDDNFIYSSLKEKVKFFHPSFHSITPEGFNSRLTFLQQCTRQGPTIRDNVPTNLAFGTPPVCILRIGDFYHTKIVIDNIGLSFDPLVWDLNPEGVGVQPMLCTVDMSFKFIGGSSLDGPINRLQNAVSYNFFANTEIYSDYADSIKISNDPEKPNKIVNGFNPNNFDIPQSNLSKGDVNSAGLSKIPDTEIIQTNRAEMDNKSLRPGEPIDTQTDTMILNKSMFNIIMKPDGKVLATISSSDMTNLTKSYQTKLQVFINNASTDLGIGSISNSNITTEILSNTEIRSVLLNDKQGTKYTFQVSINLDGTIITKRINKILATVTCGSIMSGDLLTSEEYNNYVVKLNSNNCN